jgi:hypothetical protein
VAREPANISGKDRIAVRAHPEKKFRHDAENAPTAKLSRNKNKCPKDPDRGPLWCVPTNVVVPLTAINHREADRRRHEEMNTGQPENGSAAGRSPDPSRTCSPRERLSPQFT